VTISYTEALLLVALLLLVNLAGLVVLDLRAARRQSVWRVEVLTRIDDVIRHFDATLRPGDMTRAADAISDAASLLSTIGAAAAPRDDR
jgi:hypothetical protein